MSQKLGDKLAPGGANFYTARSDEKWRHIHDVCTSLCDTSTTSARHAYEMKTRTRILNRLKFSPLLAEYLRHPETSLRHVKTFVRVPHDTWRVIASYNSQQLVAQTRDSVTGAFKLHFRFHKLRAFWHVSLLNQLCQTFERYLTKCVLSLTHTFSWILHKYESVAFRQLTKAQNTI